ANGGKRFLLERHVRREPPACNDATTIDRDYRAGRELALAQPSECVALHELECVPRRSEEELARARADPEGTTHSTREEELRSCFIEPRGRHRANELL